MYESGEQSLQRRDKEKEKKMSEQPIYAVDTGTNQPEISSLMAMADPGRTAREIKGKLEGKEFDVEKQEWFKPEGSHALMNQKGVESIMNDVWAILNLNTSISNLDDSHIFPTIISLADALIIKLQQKYKEFGIEKSELTTVCNMIINPCFFCLRRCYNEGERKWYKWSLVEKRDVHTYEGLPRSMGQNQPQQKRGFSLFNLGGK